VFNKVVRWHRLSEVENVYIAYTMSVLLPSSYQNLLKLVEIRQSSNKNAPFSETRCITSFRIAHVSQGTGRCERKR